MPNYTRKGWRLFGKHKNTFEVDILNSFSVELRVSEMLKFWLWFFGFIPRAMANRKRDSCSKPGEDLVLFVVVLSFPVIEYFRRWAGFYAPELEVNWSDFLSWFVFWAFWLMCLVWNLDVVFSGNSFRIGLFVVWDFPGAKRPPFLSWTAFWVVCLVLLVFLSWIGTNFLFYASWAGNQSRKESKENTKQQMRSMSRDSFSLWNCHPCMWLWPSFW